MSSASDLARDLVRIVGKQADSRVGRAPGQSEIGRVVRSSPLTIQAQSFTIPLTAEDLVVAMGTPLSQGALVSLVPTKGGTWTVIPLQDAPGSVSSDPTVRAGTAYDPSGSGAAQSGQVGINALDSGPVRITGGAAQWTVTGPIDNRKVNSKGYWDPMNGTPVGRGSWALGGGTHTAAGNPEHPWASINATDIFAPAGTVVVACKRLYCYSIGSGILSTDGATAGQGAYLAEENGRRWWYRHIYLKCRVGQFLNPGDPVGTLVSWTNGGAHLHLGNTVAGRGVLDARPD